MKSGNDRYSLPARLDHTRGFDRTKKAPVEGTPVTLHGDMFGMENDVTPSFFSGLASEALAIGDPVEVVAGGVKKASSGQIYGVAVNAAAVGESVTVLRQGPITLDGSKFPANGLIYGNNNGTISNTALNSNSFIAGFTRGAGECIFLLGGGGGGGGGGSGGGTGGGDLGEGGKGSFAFAVTTAGTATYTLSSTVQNIELGVPTESSTTFLPEGMTIEDGAVIAPRDGTILLHHEHYVDPLNTSNNYVYFRIALNGTNLPISGAVRPDYDGADPDYTLGGTTIVKVKKGDKIGLTVNGTANYALRVSRSSLSGSYVDIDQPTPSSNTWGYFSAKSAYTPALPAATWVKYPIELVREESNPDFTVENGYVIMPRDGVALFYGNVHTPASTVAKNAYVRIVVNDTTSIAQRDMYCAANVRPSVNTVGIFPVKKGDKVALQGYSSSATSQSTDTYATTYSVLHGCYIDIGNYSVAGDGSGSGGGDGGDIDLSKVNLVSGMQVRHLVPQNTTWTIEPEKQVVCAEITNPLTGGAKLKIPSPFGNKPAFGVARAKLPNGQWTTLSHVYTPPIYCGVVVGCPGDGFVYLNVGSGIYDGRKSGDDGNCAPDAGTSVDSVNSAEVVISLYCQVTELVATKVIGKRTKYICPVGTTWDRGDKSDRIEVSELPLPVPLGASLKIPSPFGKQTSAVTIYTKHPTVGWITADTVYTAAFYGAKATMNGDGFVYLENSATSPAYYSSAKTGTTAPTLTSTPGATEMVLAVEVDDELEVPTISAKELVECMLPCPEGWTSITPSANSTYTRWVAPANGYVRAGKSSTISGNGGIYEVTETGTRIQLANVPGLSNTLYFVVPVYRGKPYDLYKTTAGITFEFRCLTGDETKYALYSKTGAGSGGGDITISGDVIGGVETVYLVPKNTTWDREPNKHVVIDNLPNPVPKSTAYALPSPFGNEVCDVQPYIKNNNGNWVIADPSSTYGVTAACNGDGYVRFSVGTFLFDDKSGLTSQVGSGNNTSNEIIFKLTRNKDLLVRNASFAVLHSNVAVTLPSAAAEYLVTGGTETIVGDFENAGGKIKCLRDGFISATATIRTSATKTGILYVCLRKNTTNLGLTGADASSTTTVANAIATLPMEVKAGDTISVVAYSSGAQVTAAAELQAFYIDSYGGDSSGGSGGTDPEPPVVEVSGDKIGGTEVAYLVPRGTSWDRETDKHVVCTGLPNPAVGGNEYTLPSPFGNKPAVAIAYVKTPDGKWSISDMIWDSPSYYGVQATCNGDGNVHVGCGQKMWTAGASSTTPGSTVSGGTSAEVVIALYCQKDLLVRNASYIRVLDSGAITQTSTQAEYNLTSAATHSGAGDFEFVNGKIKCLRDGAIYVTGLIRDSSPSNGAQVATIYINGKARFVSGYIGSSGSYYRTAHTSGVVDVKAGDLIGIGGRHTSGTGTTTNIQINAFYIDAYGGNNSGSSTDPAPGGDTVGIRIGEVRHYSSYDAEIASNTSFVNISSPVRITLADYPQFAALTGLSGAFDIPAGTSPGGGAVPYIYLGEFKGTTPPQPSKPTMIVSNDPNDLPVNGVMVKTDSASTTQAITFNVSSDGSQQPGANTALFIVTSDDNVSATATDIGMGNTAQAGKITFKPED